MVLYSVAMAIRPVQGRYKASKKQEPNWKPPLLTAPLSTVPIVVPGTPVFKTGGDMVVPLCSGRM